MKKVRWYHYIIRFFFVPCCYKCTNIAHRAERSYKWFNVCLNHLLPRSNISVPLDCVVSAWDYNPKYNSIFQRLWVKLKLKEKGQPIKHKH
jgi:hypothetical protein